MSVQGTSPSSNLLGNVWDHFTQTAGGRGTGVVKTAVCKHCPKSFTLNKGSTSGLRYHLKSDHPSLYSAMLDVSTAEKRKSREVQDAVLAAEAGAQAETFSTPRKTPRRSQLEDAEESPQGMDRYRK
jgi:BED zinc finger